MKRLYLFVIIIFFSCSNQRFDSSDLEKRITKLERTVNQNYRETHDHKYFEFEIMDDQWVRRWIKRCGGCKARVIAYNDKIEFIQAQLDYEEELEAKYAK